MRKWRYGVIDLNQLVQVRWNPYTKNHYEQLGYKFTKFGDNFYIKAIDLMPNSEAEVQVFCDDCNTDFMKKYNQYNKIIQNNNGTYRCKSCTTKNRNKKIYPKSTYFNKFLDFCSRNGYTPISTMNDYQNAKSKLYYICPKHGKQSITLDSITSDNVGCRECSYDIISQKNRLDIKTVIDIVASKGNILLNPDDYINVQEKNLLIKCGICGNDFVTSLASQINGDGACQACAKDKVAYSNILKSDDLNNLYNTDGNIVLLNPEDYKGNNVINLRFLCAECGKEFKASKANYDAGQKRCAHCSHSKSSGEKIISDFLDSHNISYKFQQRFSDCRDKKTLPFDFYLFDYNMCIEFDGPHHFEPVYGEDRFLITQRHDAIKDEYCKNNNINLIRIPYWDGHIIDDILKNILNL